MNNEKKQEFTRRVAQANSTEMVVILYDMTLEYIEDAKAAGSASEDFHVAIGHIQGCLGELINSLNCEYEPAPAMKELYRYCIRRVGASEVKRDEAILDEVVKVIVPLRDAYDKIKGENTSGPVMGNSQEVYAGLTYGRNDVTENFVEQSNRGFRA
ncbi:MAG: flagellar protein FliS [Lachnospiraceae bacterium]|nr:flagellar protein FliS [Lachnospiraceae bacterium]